jgi:hypothetical protein
MFTCCQLSKDDYAAVQLGAKVRGNNNSLATTKQNKTKQKQSGVPDSARRCRQQRHRLARRCVRRRICPSNDYILNVRAFLLCCWLNNTNDTNPITTEKRQSGRERLCAGRRARMEHQRRHAQIFCFVLFFSFFLRPFAFDIDDDGNAFDTRLYRLDTARCRSVRGDQHRRPSAAGAFITARS